MTPGYTDDILVCKASKRHIEPIATFNVSMAMETESLELDPVRVRKGVAAVIASRELGFYLVAERDGQPVGCLLLTTEWSDWRNGMFWWIQSVYVTPEHRGRGVYRRLYHEVVKQALDSGNVCGIRLYVERSNAVAQAVYEKLGMRDSGYLVYGTAVPPD